MAVKLIAADMDGTLLDSNKNLSPHIFDLIKKLKEKDVKFAIASGRQYFNLINNFQEIKDELIYISDNGSIVYDKAKSIYVDEINKEEVIKVLQDVRKIKNIYPNCEYEEISKILKIRNNEIHNNGKGKIVIVSGGTSDIPVADEAYYTAKFLGNNVERVYDVGVAGIHRLLNKKHILQSARVVIAVAGMEGALPSVVGGLVDVPVIAVPTSVGYGANFGGLSALLTMLNSCASGISVVNIDNGFGAGYLASMINKLD